MFGFFHKLLWNEFFGQHNNLYIPKLRKHELDPWVAKIPGEGNDNSLQYSCLKNPMDRGACHTPTLQRVTESDITERLSTGSQGKTLK